MKNMCDWCLCAAKTVCLLKSRIFAFFCEFDQKMRFSPYFDPKNRKKARFSAGLSVFLVRFCPIFWFLMQKIYFIKLFRGHINT